MVWSWTFRVLGGTAVVWMLFLLAASPDLELDVGSLDPPIPATVHCDAVLQVGDDRASIDADGGVRTTRWDLDEGDRAAIESRLGDQASPVVGADGVVDANPEVTLDEAAISSSCDARRAYRVGWSVLLLGLALGAFRVGRSFADLGTEAEGQ